MTTSYYLGLPLGAVGMPSKSKVIAGIRGIPLGGFGLGRFSIGDTRIAAATRGTPVTRGLGRIRAPRRAG